MGTNNEELSKSDVVQNLSTVYGFFLILMSVLVAGLPAVKPFIGPGEMAFAYGLLWLSGLCFLHMGLEVKDLMKKRESEFDSRSLWLITLLLPVAFVGLIGETLVGDVIVGDLFTFEQLSIADVGAGAFLLVAILTEIVKWWKNRKI